ncbi:MAG: HEAT repeat domain-containing protein [Acidobacteria bacterium]|nr:HEAT repeat domain-containing protein [Acidobacteriota bacterium]
MAGWPVLEAMEMVQWPWVILAAFLGILGAMFVFILVRRAWRAYVFRRCDRFREYWGARFPSLLSGEVPSAQEMRTAEAREALESLLLNRREAAGEEEQKRLGEVFERAGLLEERIKILRRRGARWERLRSAAVLGQIRSAAAIPALSETLTDPCRPLCSEALRSLGLIGSPAAAPALLHFLRQGIPEEPAIWLDAVTACVQEAGDFLPLLQDEREEVRILAARALAESPQPLPSSLFESWSSLAFDPNPEVRAQAMRVLGRSQDERAVSLLVSGTQDEAWFVRLRAVAALASAGAPAVLEAVLRTSGDPDFRVRQRAAATLASLAARPAQVLEWLVNMQDRYAVEGFLSQLARSGLLWRALPLLLAPGESKRQDAEKLLSGAVAAGYYQFLLDAVESHPEWRVRLAIARLLAEADNPELAEELQRRLWHASTPRLRRLLRAILSRQAVLQRDEINDSMAHRS